MAELNSGEVDTPKATGKPLDAEIEAWIGKVIQGMNDMANNEEARKAIEKRIF